MLDQGGLTSSITKSFGPAFARGADPKNDQSPYGIPAHAKL